MSTPKPDNSMQEIEYLRWRDELLQVMYWMLGEGLGARPTVSQIQTFLGADPLAVGYSLERMAGEGYVRELGEGCFELTALGMTDGKRSFADEFSALTHQAHGECSPDCTFCHSPEGDPSDCPSKRVSHAAAG